MVFSSTVFVSLFLPIVLLVNNRLPPRASNIFLIAASLFLYAWGEPLYVFLLIALALINYALAFLVERRGKLGLTLALVVNLGALFSFKYLGFFAEIIGARAPEIRLPIGVSFYTFQSMSYIFDVKRGECAPQRDLSKLMLYISLFPQLIAGPIVKYKDIMSYLVSRNADASDIARGLKRFCFGLAKKVLIANVLARCADAAFALPTGDMSAAAAWLGAIAYALQIFYDFSGYSDMAIGMGEALGFHFRENFARPYAAWSMRDFWRRWHISLSSWFRDYVYIPLGGNRRGKARAAVNRFIVFLLTGLWHGANWTFVIWGLLNGLLVSVEGLIKPRESRVARAIGHIYVPLTCALLFVIFRADSLSHALAYLSRMVSFDGISAAQRVFLADMIDARVILTFIAAAICAGDWSWLTKTKLAPLGYISSLILLMLCLMSLTSQAYNPFIYFRF